ncbi:MAG: hydrogenase maturation protease [Candidatus Heimdallarchaeota archaeon]|nr:hydrogenase maturation protease [Candidatus Heimdallarchaeota archaeon]
MNIEGSKLLKKLNTTKKICLMGIGNFDRADDAVGIAIIEELQKFKFPSNIKLINAGPVPESFTGVIKREEPDFLIIIDAAQMDKAPGTIKVFTEKNIDTAYMVTSHKVPMTMYTKYLKNTLKNLTTIFIGIQPFSVSYMVEMSPEVKKSITILCEYLVELLR